MQLALTNKAVLSRDNEIINWLSREKNVFFPLLLLKFIRDQEHAMPTVATDFS